MEIKSLILNEIKKKGEVKTADIVEKTGFSRTYINKFLRELRDEGKVVLVGETDRARYVLASEEDIERVKKKIKDFQRKYKNEGLSEDEILGEVKSETGTFLGIEDNIERILDYSFTEMVNNAIEHSESEEIVVKVEKDDDLVRFDVIDYGIGIFNNIMKKKGLNSQLEAIQDLLKGKETTDPESHSGEGIFFTSKVASSLTFRSGVKKLIFNNRIDDIFIEDIRKTEGTRVIFTIDLDSDTRLEEVFKEFSVEGSYEFSKTKVVVKLFKIDTEYISRSQARRITAGLDKFKKVILDFDEVETVGQAFADEIFRVWVNNHPNTDIEYKNVNENVEFMIKRAEEK